MKNFAKENEISLLMLSENIYEDIMNFGMKAFSKNIMVLDEGLGTVNMVCESMIDENASIKHVSKFQPAAKIVQGIIDYCTESSEDFEGLGTETLSGKGQIIGLYSPISKCGQTRLAVSISEKLAQKSKVIFLSLESFSSLAVDLGIDGEDDITDLLYYADCEKNKIGLYLEKIKKTRNGVDFILPAKTAMQVREINSERLKELLFILINECGYDYCIIDMTEYVEDFFEIEKMCHKIFTITKQNPSDEHKIRTYEEVLKQSEQDEIIAKTVKCPLPEMRDIKGFDLFTEKLLESEGIIIEQEP